MIESNNKRLIDMINMMRGQFPKHKKYLSAYINMDLACEFGFV